MRLGFFEEDSIAARRNRAAVQKAQATSEVAILAEDLEEIQAQWERATDEEREELQHLRCCVLRQLAELSEEDHWD
jgi:transposase